MITPTHSSKLREQKGGNGKALSRIITTAVVVALALDLVLLQLTVRIVH